MIKKSAGGIRAVYEDVLGGEHKTPTVLMNFLYYCIESFRTEGAIGKATHTIGNIIFQVPLLRNVYRIIRQMLAYCFIRGLP